MRVDLGRRMLLEPVPGAEDDLVDPQIGDPAVHYRGWHEPAHRIALTGGKQGRLFDRGVSDRPRPLPVAIDVAVIVEPAAKAGTGVGVDVDRQLVLGEERRHPGVSSDRPTAPVASASSAPAAT